MFGVYDVDVSRLTRLLHIYNPAIAPTTVHTTVPIHEKIHEAPIVHEATTLPTVTLDEFK
jgi:hypothetical protein